MLTTLYAATTISAWILTAIGTVAFCERLKTEGYKTIKKEKTKSEKLLENTRAVFYMLTPGLNFLIGYLLVFKFEELYPRMLKGFIKDGKVIKDEPKEEVEIDLQTKEMNNPKKYSDLTNEQKLVLLEEEKRRLLKQKDVQQSEEKSYNDRGAYSKKRN